MRLARIFRARDIKLHENLLRYLPHFPCLPITFMTKSCFHLPTFRPPFRDNLRHSVLVRILFINIPTQCSNNLSSIIVSSIDPVTGRIMGVPHCTPSDAFFKIGPLEHWPHSVEGVALSCFVESNDGCEVMVLFGDFVESERHDRDLGYRLQAALK